jgi:cytochrome c oxidase subunit II
MMDALHAFGPQAAHIVDLWRITIVVCSLVFAAVLVAVLLALWRAPRSGPHTAPDLSALERPDVPAQRRVAWATAVVVLLLLGLIMASVMTDRLLARLPLRDALHIELTAHQWWWELRYSDADPSREFNTANELHVPVGRPVILTLRSDDVIHSFWVPSVSGKKDLVPGRDTTHLMRVDQPGEFRGQCAEFCGAQHAWMALDLIAEPPAQFEAWAERQRGSASDSGDAQQQRGRALFLSGTCAMCHTIAGTDASARRAPDLTHVGSRKRIAAGTLPNNADALAQWIRDPQRFKPGVNMPSHPTLSNGDLAALAAYLGSLK